MILRKTNVTQFKNLIKNLSLSTENVKCVHWNVLQNYLIINTTTGIVSSTVKRQHEFKQLEIFNEIL